MRACVLTRPITKIQEIFVFRPLTPENDVFEVVILGDFFYYSQSSVVFPGTQDVKIGTRGAPTS